MAETEECAQRACFRMADVTVTHSVTTSATGLTATEMGRDCRPAASFWSVSEDTFRDSGVAILGRDELMNECVAANLEPRGGVLAGVRCVARS